MSFPGPVCYFCGKPPLGEFKVRSATPIECARLNGRLPETFSLLCLCQTHYDVLAAAGERGRVHGRSSARWWLDGPAGWWRG
jgi:hypothetical protein